MCENHTQSKHRSRKLAIAIILLSAFIVLVLLWDRYYFCKTQDKRCAEKLRDLIQMHIYEIRNETQSQPNLVHSINRDKLMIPTEMFVMLIFNCQNPWFVWGQDKQIVVLIYYILWRYKSKRLTESNQHNHQ